MVGVGSWVAGQGVDHEVGDEAVNLVEDEARLHPLDPRLPQHRDRLRPHLLRDQRFWLRV